MSRRALSWAPVAALLLAVFVVQVGWRQAAPDGVTVRPPAIATGVLDRVRAAPFAAIADPSAAALVSGVVLGRSESIDTTTQTAFLDSGLWHLMAASGQNVGLVAMLCLALAQVAGAPKLVGAVAACGAIAGYVVVVGSGASIVRAGILSIALLFAWLLGRSADPRRVLIVSAAIICWVWPGAYRGLGMQLSYACVLALMWKCESWTEALVRRGIWQWLAALIAATALCGLVTAPILALRTGSAPLSGSIANVIAVPLAGAILVVGLAGIGLWTVGLTWLGSMLLVPVAWSASALARIAERAAALPAAQFEDRLVVVGVPIVIGLLMVVHDRVTREPLRRWVVRMGVVGILSVLMWSGLARMTPHVGITLPGGPARAMPRPAGDLRMAVLDIGQGDSTLLATDAGAILVDVGPPDGQVVRRVRQMGVTHVDGVVLTHDSLDHRGGYDAVMAELHPRWIAKPLHAPGPWGRILDVPPPKLFELCDGSSLSLGASVQIEIRNPPCDGHVIQRTSDIHNDGAIVMVIHDRGVTMVIPADAEAPILRRLALPHVDVLRVSHHGSSDPDLPALLEQVHPEVAAISVGAHNDYGHPRADTLHALDAGGVRTYRTDQDGTVVFDSDGRRVHVQLVPRNGR